jgi:hypothetical protein
MSPDSARPLVDIHVHVGVLGDDDPSSGAISPWMRHQIPFQIFLLYNRIDPADLSDNLMRQRLLQVIRESMLDQVVCLALDPVYTPDGARRPELSNMWVDNSYVIGLAKEFQASLPTAEQSRRKILLGASVHPYDPTFRERVAECVDWGAVLLKWLPSAQQINLADPRVDTALTFLATARQGRPLPLLVHVGPEYAIISTDPHTTSYDFLSWDWLDRFWNRLRSNAERWATPDVLGIERNLTAGLQAGACIIFAHCGLPYIAPSFLGKLAEHSDLNVVRDYLKKFPGTDGIKGKCFADVSACVTPFRKSYFGEISNLPPGSLLAGSDFPVPVFELSADLEENWEDFKAIMAGHFERIVIPQDNLLDVNWRELRNAFPGHAMFANAAQLLSQGP